MNRFRDGHLLSVHLAAIISEKRLSSLLTLVYCFLVDWVISLSLVWANLRIGPLSIQGGSHG
jgi:hypothetical protein